MWFWTNCCSRGICHYGLALPIPFGFPMVHLWGRDTPILRQFLGCLGKNLFYLFHVFQSLQLFYNRFMVGSWLFYSFLLRSAYGGNLVAFITTPQLTKPIHTLNQLIKSGLPWDMVLYGEEVETALAESEEFIFKTIWDQKNVVPYQSTPNVKNHNKTNKNIRFFISTKKRLIIN